MHKKIEDVLTAYKRALTAGAEKVNALRKKYGEEMSDPKGWDSLDYNEYQILAARLAGMEQVLGLTEAEKRQLDRECGWPAQQAVLG